MTTTTKKYAVSFEETPKEVREEKTDPIGSTIPDMAYTVRQIIVMGQQGIDISRFKKSRLFSDLGVNPSEFDLSDLNTNSEYIKRLIEASEKENENEMKNDVQE